MTGSTFSVDAADHLAASATATSRLLYEVDRIDRWGSHLAVLLLGGGRVLVAGNGGSAAHAQHLTSELVGRYREDRVPLSALALHAESSTVTALLNDYGGDEVFARQVRAHGRPRDVLLTLSTSGHSANLLSAAHAAHAQRMLVWAMTGSGPNPLAASADDALVVDAPSTAVVQEVHQVVVHLLCEALETALRIGECEALGRA